MASRPSRSDTSLIRRIYLYVALIALGGTTLITLITLLAAVLTEILGQGSGFLDDALIPGLSIVIPAAAFFAYHVLILREDSHRTVDTTAAPSVIPSAAEESKDSITQTTPVTPPTPHTIPGPPYILPDWKSPTPLIPPPPARTTSSLPTRHPSPIRHSRENGNLDLHFRTNPRNATIPSFRRKPESIPLLPYPHSRNAEHELNLAHRQ